MLFDVLGTGSNDLGIAHRVARVARLEIIKVSSDAAIIRPARLIEKAFQFIAAVDRYLFFGRHREPVEIGRRFLRPVRLHCHFRKPA